MGVAFGLRFFAFTGTLCILLGIVSAALRYRGRQGEAFSLLNHFISELGEVGVSRSARAFNLGLLLGGLFFIPFLIGLGIAFHELLAWLGAAAGVLTVLGVSAVGLFPMNNLHIHATAAMVYFRGGLVMVLFFGLAILFQPPGITLVPKLLNLLSLAALIVYAAFLILMARDGHSGHPVDTLEPLATPDRPEVDPLAIMEWAVFLVSILWVAVVAIFI